MEPAKLIKEKVFFIFRRHAYRRKPDMIKHWHRENKKYNIVAFLHAFAAEITSSMKSNVIERKMPKVLNSSTHPF